MDAATLVGALVARRAAVEAEIKGQVDELQAIDRMLGFYGRAEIARLPDAQADAALKAYRGRVQTATAGADIDKGDLVVIADHLPATLGGGAIVVPAEAVSAAAADSTPGDGAFMVGGPASGVTDAEADWSEFPVTTKEVPPSPANRPGFLPKPAKKAAADDDRLRLVARELAGSRKEAAAICKSLGLRWAEVMAVLKPKSRLGHGPEYFDTNENGWVLTPLGRETLL